MLSVEPSSSHDNSDAGFVVKYFVGGKDKCYKDCGRRGKSRGGGTCAESGLCVCEAGRAGADCSIKVGLEGV
eukprot:1189708-Prorocentrum_minimum.AAC.4